MQLLIFAHPPPPVHGQSVMVKMLLDRLPQRPGFIVRCVDARLSRDSADIGRWRPGKVFALLAACFRAWNLRRRHGPAFLYYIPAPGKRGALYRDFLVMLLCRPFCSGLILHWHAVGLGAWLATRANFLERAFARRLLGDATLALVLAPALAADARALNPRRLEIVPNAIDDPASEKMSSGGLASTPSAVAGPRTVNPTSPASSRPPRCRLLFLGLCSREKGVFDLLAAFALLAARQPGVFHLTLAGSFANAADETAFRAQLAALPPGAADYIGFADEARKRALFAATDVFCFPTHYPHEGQPLTLIEALAHDIRIVTTRWRAIPEMLPATHVWFATPGQPESIADALTAAAAASPPHGALRRHYLAHFTPDHHVDALVAALRPLRSSAADKFPRGGPPPPPR